MRAPAFTPYASRGRKPVVAILLTFALCSMASIGVQGTRGGGRHLTQKVIGTGRDAL